MKIFQRFIFIIFYFFITSSLALSSNNLKIIHKLSNKQELNKIERFFLSIFYKISKFFYVYQFGWKLYELVKNVIKKLLPKSAYKNLKKIFNKRIEHFKNVRFKF